MPDEPTLGELFRKVEDLHSDVRRVLDDHEQRLRKLERWAYAIPPTFILGAASVVAAVLKS